MSRYLVALALATASLVNGQGLVENAPLGIHLNSASASQCPPAAAESCLANYESLPACAAGVKPTFNTTSCCDDCQALTALPSSGVCTNDAIAACEANAPWCAPGEKPFFDAAKSCCGSCRRYETACTADQVAQCVDAIPDCTFGQIPQYTAGICCASCKIPAASCSSNSTSSSSSSSSATGIQSSTAPIANAPASTQQNCTLCFREYPENYDLWSLWSIANWQSPSSASQIASQQYQENSTWSQGAYNLNSQLSSQAASAALNATQCASSPLWLNVSSTFNSTSGNWSAIQTTSCFSAFYREIANRWCDLPSNAFFCSQSAVRSVLDALTVSNFTISSDNKTSNVALWYPNINGTWYPAGNSSFNATQTSNSWWQWHQNATNSASETFNSTQLIQWVLLNNWATENFTFTFWNATVSNAPESSSSMGPTGILGGATAAPATAAPTSSSSSFAPTATSPYQRTSVSPSPSSSLLGPGGVAPGFPTPTSSVATAAPTATSSVATAAPTYIKTTVGPKAVQVNYSGAESVVPSAFAVFALIVAAMRA